MRVLLGAVLVAPAVFSLPPEIIRAQPQLTNLQLQDERLPRSPTHLSSNFRVIEMDRVPFSFFETENEIPFETRDEFTPPDPRSKEARERKYFGNARFSTPPHAHLVVHDEPFFDTLDHGQLVLALERRRKNDKLPPHVLKSLRPYFPFFSLD